MDHGGCAQGCSSVTQFANESLSWQPDDNPESDLDIGEQDSGETGNPDEAASREAGSTGGNRKQKRRQARREAKSRRAAAAAAEPEEFLEETVDVGADPAEAEIAPVEDGFDEETRKHLFFRRARQMKQ